MQVMAVSAVSQQGAFWGALKGAYGQLPVGAQWTLATSSTDGTRAVNVIAADSVESVRSFIERHAGAYATTECFELDAANAVGLPPITEERAPAATPSGAEPSRAGRPAAVPSASAAAPWVDRIRDRLSGLLATYQIPSAQVGVLADGEIVDVALGVTDVATGEPATTETVYQVGSMTKTWTALAFMQLVDEGRVSLDEPVRRYLPGFRVADPATSARVTPRHLLNHTNGIEELYGDPGEDDDVVERMVAGITAAPQVFPLGETHGYSAALGYAILARIMEVTDGERWDAVMARRLFRPLGLSSTSTWRGQLDPARAAVGHVVRSPGERPMAAPVQSLPRAFGPGGNIASTARDVLRMASLFFTQGIAPDGSRLLSADAIREMSRSVVPIPDPYVFGPWWGLGLIVADWHGERVLLHDGSTIGQNARLRILPERNLAIAMLTNGAPRERFSREALNVILAELGAGSVPEPPEPDPNVRLDVGRYVGTYERPGSRFEVDAPGGRLRLTLVRDAWQARVSGQPERTAYQLAAIDETHFLMRSGEAGEDLQTVAIYGAGDGPAQYLHTNCRVHPRVAPTTESIRSR